MTKSNCAGLRPKGEPVIASVAVLAPISTLQGQQLEHAIVSVTAAADTITERLRSRIAIPPPTTTQRGLSK